MKKEVFSKNKNRKVLAFKIIFLVISVLILILVCFFVYTKYLYNFECGGSECFIKRMEKCLRTDYINDADEATWKYEIKGIEGGLCRIDVELVQAKEGELWVSRVEGFDMECFYERGVSAYPEKDLAKCHGRLKEELQTEIIKKLHSYVLTNVGDINRSLG